MIVAIFWLGQFGANTLFMQLSEPSMTAVSLVPRALVCIAGALISIGFIAVQDRRSSRPLRERAYIAIAFTFVSAGLLGILNRYIFEAFLGLKETSSFLIAFTASLVPRLWIFGTIYAMSLAVSYSAEVRRREEEIVALKALAQDAHLRALRSQLNPHFLFNALNSITALIADGRAQQAETITEDLADFLRITLSLDPQRQITLKEEVALQRIFLDIQKVRFPTRLDVAIDIDAGAENALVPNLILQPLVENSIKYAVARSSLPVTLSIRAVADGDRLKIVVEDDGGDAGRDGRSKGAHVGLANVAERLAGHYGEEVKFQFGASPESGYRNTIEMPLRVAP